MFAPHANGRKLVLAQGGQGDQKGKEKRIPHASKLRYKGIRLRRAATDGEDLRKLKIVA
jgi:hypothetical protein